MSEAKHIPEPWVWMDCSETIPNKDNDGSKGVEGLYVDKDGDCDDLAVLQAVAECDDWPEHHPYRQRFHHRSECGAIAVRNPTDLALIAAAPDLLEACKAVIRDMNIPGPPVNLSMETCLMIEAAIAKAENKEP